MIYISAIYIYIERERERERSYHDGGKPGVDGKEDMVEERESLGVINRNFEFQNSEDAEGHGGAAEVLPGWAHRRLTLHIHIYLRS